MKSKAYLMAMCTSIFFVSNAYGGTCPFYTVHTLNDAIKLYYRTGAIPPQHPDIGNWQINPKTLPLHKFTNVTNPKEADNMGQCTYQVTSESPQGQKTLILEKKK